jgi:hypothetical protein
MKILRRLDISELHTGMIVASEQNDDHLYELDLNEYPKIKYRSVAKIVDGEFKKHNSDFWHKTIFTGWVETEESRKINPQTKREDRLKELGL